MNAFKETEIGIIPNEWEVDTIGNNFKIKQGKAVSKRNRIGNNQKPFLRTANVFWNKIDLSVLDNMHFTQAEELILKLNKFDLLVCEGGDVGRTAICLNDMEGIYFQNHLHRLRVKNDKVIPYFFLFWNMYCLKNTNFYTGIENKSTIPNLSQSRLSSLSFPVPDKIEQTKIVDILKTIQGNIDIQYRLINILQDLKSALMKKLFSEGLNNEPLKDTEIGKIPVSWEVVNFGDKYRFTSKSKIVKFKDEELIPFVPMELIPEDKISCSSFILKSKLNLKSGTYFENGDLLIAKITPSFENGKQTLINIPFNYGFATTEVIPVKGIPEESSLAFLYYYLKKDDIRKLLADKMEGTTGRKRLSKNVLIDLIIPWPNYQEQKNIAGKLGKIDVKIGALKVRKNILIQLFNKLLNQLMTGKIRVNHLKI
jgi:type I restriction enzyme, S subunit